MKSKEVSFVFFCFFCIVMLIMSEHRAGACIYPCPPKQFHGYNCHCLPDSAGHGRGQKQSLRKAAHIKYMKKALKSASSRLQVSFLVFVHGSKGPWVGVGCWMSDDMTVGCRMYVCMYVPPFVSRWDNF